MQEETLKFTAHLKNNNFLVVLWLFGNGRGKVKYNLAVQQFMVEKSEIQTEPSVEPKLLIISYMNGRHVELGHFPSGHEWPLAVTWNGYESQTQPGTGLGGGGGACAKSLTNRDKKIDKVIMWTVYEGTKMRTLIKCLIGNNGDICGCNESTNSLVC